ncbi:MAG: KOW domain-containing RNA-binding protein [Oscillospiraceae bacterium]|jgi:ribosomal protein L14E/L6E/L27E|nr:KOW domain-containing RNA-binding protein [Oscillospiraceae bacterium]
MAFQVGNIVVSPNGRDKGKVFYIVSIEEDYAFIADGRGRRLEKPKKKKLRHLQFRADGSDRVAEKLRNGEKLTNIEIRRSVAAYSGDDGEEQGGM